MPGVIMDEGDRNGSHTNHDRDRQPNGINGGGFVEKALEKGKQRAEPQQNVTPTSPTIPNGLSSGFRNMAQSEVEGVGKVEIPPELDRMSQLPPEIAHITEGYVSLSTLLTRLAQKSHNDLSEKILQLAQMPVPASAVNGNSSHITAVDDNSPENIAKKQALLDFVQSKHADWTKALVITKWSRQSEDVSKIIDLKIHLDQKKTLYDMAIHEMTEMKRSLGQARLPNPDLKTALQVLSTGKAPWMPELGYIEPPPLTSQDLLKTLENLDTLLSMRLNLLDYDNIPLHFKDYTIKSGRVTFRVAGEFELDLTIANEDPESQFWFIDFRFIFSPSLSEIPFHLRSHIESRVNAALFKDGLPGCYKLLHEMVLTHKISEFRRQAVELARGKWIDGIKVEALNRALSIQYWVDRFGKSGNKSWILLGVHSGRRKDGRPDPKATSRLFIRWFRDGKEITETDILFDAVNISVESLLKTVIAKHVSHFLTSTHEKLMTKPLFKKDEAALSLSISSQEPAESELKVQLTNREHLRLSVEPITGRFIFSPASMPNAQMEYQFNNKSKDPAKDAHGWIENLRCQMAATEITSHALSVGWVRIGNTGIKDDGVKTVVPKDTLQVAWFRRPGWKKEWFMMVSLSMSGERWWLIETASEPAPKAPLALKVVSHLEIPIKATSPVPTYAFLSTLNIFASALLSHFTNLRALHSHNSFYSLRYSKGNSPIKVPSIYIRLSNLLPSGNKSSRTGKPWAKDTILLAFQGLETATPEDKAEAPEAVPPTPQLQAPNTPVVPQPPAGGSVLPPIQEESTVMITEARMVVPVPAALSILKEKVDQEIAFHSQTGTFAFRLRSKVGEDVIPSLIERINRVEKLVDFVEVLHKHENSLKCESISLGKIVFTYGSSSANAMDIDGVKTYRAIVDFGAADNSMTLVFDEGNPHLRIADNLTRVLNQNQGLDGVATLLPLTLPALRGLDAIEAAWSPLSETGEALIFVRAVEWYIIRYNLTTLSPDADSLPTIRKVIFDIKLQQRRGEPWWYIRRINPTPNDKEGDDIDAALKPLWNDSGDGWRGMRVSAVAQPHGAEGLLSKLDEVIRTLDPGPKPAVPAQIAPVAPMQAQPQPIKGPVRQPQLQQQRQQPTPSQSQSQGSSQGRGNLVKREIVEID